MFDTTIAYASKCLQVYKFLQLWANPQKYQTLTPAKNSHLKVYNHTHCHIANRMQARFTILTITQFSDKGHHSLH